MRILNWNVERLQKLSEEKASEFISHYDADIIILTETSSKIKLPAEYSFHTSSALKNKTDNISYKEGEVRTAIYSRYPILSYHKTIDKYTNCAVTLDSDLGHIIVYATIIGIFGNRGERFSNDIDVFKEDILSLPSEMPLLVAGDFNQSFADNYYYTKAGRMKLLAFFESQSLVNITKDIPDNIDHILMKKPQLSKLSIKISVFNTDKSLSDHIGIVVDIN